MHNLLEAYCLQLLKCKVHKFLLINALFATLELNVSLQKHKT